ncbi:MAG: hypothetical protein LEGION0398_MBIBDBAK_00471 [Legionellaceae bacterium]
MADESITEQTTLKESKDSNKEQTTLKESKDSKYDALKLIHLRQDFYYDSSKKLIMILLSSFFIIIVLIAAFVYQIMNPPAPKYFAVNSDGRLIKLPPLNEPNMEHFALLQWGNTAAIAAYTYSFVNYRQELQAASSYFTPNGWQNFVTALQDSGNLQAVIAKKLIVSAVAKGAPVILQEGLLNGRYTWRVQMPMLITYQSASQKSEQDVIVTMLITRVSPLNSARGIGIAQFIVASAGGGQ